MRRLLPIALLLLLASCSPPSFVAQRFDNFTAYYNTFYNAQKAFDEGMRAIETSDTPIDRDRYLPVFVPPEDVTNTQDFEQAIQKSADVLRDHPNSKWVDDALMLIGKSYFYQQNYVGAAQKFRETIAIESGLEGEARFWLARALVAAGEYEAAAEHLRTSLDGEATYGRWTDMMHLVRGELRVRQGMWEEAAVALERGLNGEPDDEAAARAAFLLGQVRETMGAYNAAARAFEYVNEAYQPRYELSYAARVSAIRVRGHAGEGTAALQQLRRMERDDKHYDKRAELALLRAELYRAQGEPKAAHRMLRTLLYGDNPPRGEVRGRAHYLLGAIHQHAYEDFNRAAAYYDSAATALGRRANGGNAMGFAPVAITDNESRAELFGNLAERAEAVSRMDSLLHLGSLDDAAFRQFVATLQQRQTAERVERRQAEARQRDEQRFGGDASGVEREAVDTPSTTTANTGGSNFLFHQDPVRAQEARRSFERRWGRRPLVPNWRRREAISAQTSAGRTARDEEQLVTSDVLVVPEEEDSLATMGVDVSDVPRDSVSQAQMRAQRATARYELANALFLAAQRPDSAAVWYRRVIEEDADQPVARRALYALAEVHRARGDTARARTLYRQVVAEYPDSPFAEQARERLGEALPQDEADAFTQAKAAYARAYDTWQQGKADAALDRFIEVAHRYATTPTAPKALWAAAMVLREQHADRGLAPDTPLPPRFDRVLARADTAQAVADTARAVADTTAISADTTATLHASRSAIVEGLSAARPTLRDLMAFIHEQYPEAPQARRAERLLAVMAPPADSSAAASDSVTADSVTSDSVAADSIARGRTADTTAAHEATGAVRMDSTGVDTTSASPEARAAPFEGGGWAIAVAARSNQDEAEAVRQTFRARFQDEGLPVEVYEAVVDRETWYRVAVGRFADEQDATTAMQRYADQLPEDAWVVRVP